LPTCVRPLAAKPRSLPRAGLTSRQSRRGARIVRLRENLTRLSLPAAIVEADASSWSPPTPFDAVLLDAPCTATGTIRRHPDILRLKRDGDIAQLASTQSALLSNALKLVKPGGLLVYCVCSLEPEEGIDQIERVLALNPSFERLPVNPGEIGNFAEAITAAGDLRTRPDQLPNADPQLSGLDGFYAARLKRIT